MNLSSSDPRSMFNNNLNVSDHNIVQTHSLSAFLNLVPVESQSQSILDHDYVNTNNTNPNMDNNNKPIALYNNTNNNAQFKNYFSNDRTSVTDNSYTNLSLQVSHSADFSNNVNVKDNLF